MTLNTDTIRKQFPALSRPVVFLDNPGGSQIARPSLDRIESYLVNSNANYGGAFATSQDTVATVAAARTAMADFINARQPDEIVFGPNMTTLTYILSRALVRTFQPGDTLVVTQLDHDANISPWLQAAEDRGCRVRWVDFNPTDGTLDLDDLQAALNEKPRLLAVGYASNALGTINPLSEIIQRAHAAGALVYVDAVQYAAHGTMDVQSLDCDFLACSAYKFFGPHLGILYGRYELLDGLRAYRVRPSSPNPPGKFETGTAAFESISGLLGALEYLQWVGEEYGSDFRTRHAPSYEGRKLVFKQAMSAIQVYELELNLALLSAIQQTPGVQLYGISDEKLQAQRVPTFSFTLDGLTPHQVAEQMGERDIYLWNGNFHALAVTQRLAKALDLSQGVVMHRTDPHQPAFV
ncbi:MAG: cysteine desulfurase-like protein, partial [Anaerolineaceae bacterium]|nr:cysteine desulfurase-like protein [Anaerolineaceae bacterium]